MYWVILLLVFSSAVSEPVNTEHKHTSARHTVSMTTTFWRKKLGNKHLPEVLVGFEQC